MYFNFEENHPDTPRLASSLSVLERVLLTTVIYLVVVIGVLVVPKTEWYKARLLAQEQARQELEQQQMQPAPEEARWVFTTPRPQVTPPKPTPRADLSDADDEARSVERPVKPSNPLPFSRGNSSERTDVEKAGPRLEPVSPMTAAPEPSRAALPFPESDSGRLPAPSEVERAQSAKPTTGILADAIRNVQKYAGTQTFNNPDGGAPDANYPSIRFDAKGVEFGPWIRRFVAQIRRNWFIPYAAMSMRGHVVVTFYVHKDGRITELQVMKPSSVEAFTNSAHNALAASNPTVPLPPEYPDPKAFFTVTFYFNEDPGR